MEIRLEPKQSAAFLTEATEVLYGGAAGGGKSFLLRVSMIRWCVEVGGIQCYLFRRTLPDLRDNHLRGPTSFFALLGLALERGECKYRAVENEFEWTNGSILHLCYCDSENDVEKYRGAEIHVLGMDELTHFSEYQYRFLRSRVRVAGLKIPEKYRGRLPRVENASNPGSIGHAWVKRTFIQPQAPMRVWRAGAGEGGMVRQFIPARLADNPHLMGEDPEYANRLRGLGADTLVRAMLDGDWDIIAGAAFEKLRRETHCLEPFEPPKEWLRFGSLDWGSSRPFSYGMWAIAGDETKMGGIKVQRGAMIRYDEVYGWNGKPNEGLRMEAPEVAREILKKENAAKPAYRIADNSMWKVDGGPSIAETFAKFGCVLRPSSKGPGSRHNGYVEVRTRIAGNDDGPMLFATSNCHAGFWRTMPDLVMDEHQYGIKSEQIDCWVAGTMISTPKGDVPIERVNVGDFVDTPIGPRRVLKSYVSGMSVTCRVVPEDRRTIRGTPRHKVFVDGKGLVPLSEVKCYDLLITKEDSWREKQLYTAVLSSLERKTPAITLPSYLLTDSFGCWLMEKYQRAITSITRITTEAITALRTLNAFQLLSMHSTITENAAAWQNINANGPAPRKAKKSFGKQCSLSEQKCRRRNLRASIVESLLRQPTHTNNSVLASAKKITTGKSSLAQSAELRSDIKEATKNNAALVRIVAVGHSGERVPVYNLTVDEAHLFYANGILSSNTDQEDHVSDEVMYACMSRPWLRHVEEKKPKVDRWMRFEEKEEESWRTA